jgi:hypothetical protein
MNEATYRADSGIVEIEIETLPSGRFVPLVTLRFADDTVPRRQQFAEIFATRELALEYGLDCAKHLFPPANRNA